MKPFKKMNSRSKRLDKNQSKAVILSVKQHCNEAIKRTKKDKSINDNVRAQLIAIHERCKISY